MQLPNYFLTAVSSIVNSKRRIQDKRRQDGATAIHSAANCCVDVSFALVGHLVKAKEIGIKERIVAVRRSATDCDGPSTSKLELRSVVKRSSTGAGGPWITDD